MGRVPHLGLEEQAALGLPVQLTSSLLKLPLIHTESGVAPARYVLFM